MGDDLEDDEDEDEHGGKEDPNPLCSDDDVSDDEPAELFDTENVVVCQYDKVELKNLSIDHFLQYIDNTNEK